MMQSDNVASVSRDDSLDSQTPLKQELTRTSSQRAVLSDMKSSTLSIIELLKKLKRGKQISDSESDEAEKLLERMLSLKARPGGLDVMNQIATEPVDEELKQFLADTLANPAEQLPGATVPPMSTKRPFPGVSRTPVFQSVRHFDGTPPPPISLPKSGPVTEFSPVSLRALELGNSLENYDAYAIDDATGGHCLSSLGVWLFQTYHFPEQFGLDISKVAKAFEKYESLYRDNPYHNRWHAADVLQCCHYMLMYCGMAPFFTPLEQLALLLSALIHDLDHPGTNNAFQVATHSTLGLLYNDRSVLENHHVALAFSIIWSTEEARKELDFLDVLTADERQNLRKMVIEMVLGTDLAVNLEIVNLFKLELEHGKFDSLIDGIKKGQDIEECSVSEDRILLLKMMVKCADISHVARPLHYHLKWTTNVTKEFYAQGDRERELHIPVAPFMDRYAGGLAKGQAGFLQFVAKPMWILLEPFMSNRVLIDRLEANLEHWQIEAKRDADAFSLKAADSPQTPSQTQPPTPSQTQLRTPTTT